MMQEYIWIVFISGESIKGLKFVIRVEVRVSFINVCHSETLDGRG